MFDADVPRELPPPKSQAGNGSPWRSAFQSFSIGGTHSPYCSGPLGLDRHKITWQPQSSACASPDANTEAARLMTRATAHRHSEHHAIERMSRSRMERLPVEGLSICKARLNRVELTRDDVEAGAHCAPGHARRVIGTRKVQYRYANGLRLCDLVQARHVEISIRIL